MYKIVDPETGNSFFAPIIDAKKEKHIRMHLPPWDSISEREKDLYRTQALFKLYPSPHHIILNHHEQVVERTARELYEGV